MSQTHETPTTRFLVLEGAFNARDLGGFRTLDGLQTRRQRVFRSAHLHRLTHGDIQQMHELGVRTVCDLRSADEISWTGIGPLFESGAVRHVHQPFFGDTVRNYNEGRPRDVEERRALWHSRGYDSMLEMAAPAIARMFALMADLDHYALVIHCVAGKDRTGVLSALTLRALGVPDEDIIDDYALTARTRPADELLRTMLRENGVDPDTARDDPWQAPPAVMEATLRILDETWGSTEGYLNAIGVPEEHLAALRALMLEPVE
ncbi:MAG TPA: tyrosine-protein phosphatase [Thermomicrobiales bacterium]|nr:tyrosine-protein phosphatase [Thermomicrobiales bacterium]